MYELWLKYVVIVTVELGLHCLIVKNLAGNGYINRLC